MRVSNMATIGVLGLIKTIEEDEEVPPSEESSESGDEMV